MAMTGKQVGQVPVCGELNPQVLFTEEPMYGKEQAYSKELKGRGHQEGGNGETGSEEIVGARTMGDSGPWI